MIFVVFHEGLKSWSCCSSKNKRESLHLASWQLGRRAAQRSAHRSLRTAVTSFDEFLSIPGCATGSHSSERPVEPVKPVAPAAPAPTTKTADGREVYGVAPSAPPKTSVPVPQEAAKPKSTCVLSFRKLSKQCQCDFGSDRFLTPQGIRGGAGRSRCDARQRCHLQAQGVRCQLGWRG